MLICYFTEYLHDTEQKTYLEDVGINEKIWKIYDLITCNKFYMKWNRK